MHGQAGAQAATLQRPRAVARLWQPQPSDFEVERGGAAFDSIGKGVLGGGVEAIASQAAMGEAMGLVSLSGKVLGRWTSGASGGCVSGASVERLEGACLEGVVECVSGARVRSAHLECVWRECDWRLRLGECVWCMSAA